MSEPEDFKDELLEFYKGSYETEIERKDKLLDRVSLAVGFLTILGGILGFYLTSLEIPQFRWAHLAFYIPLALGCVTTIVSMVCVARSVAKGFRYAYIPSPMEVANFVRTAEDLNAQVPKAERADIRASFREHLGDQYCKCAAINWNHNTTRSGYLFWAIRWAVASMFIAILALPGFFLIKKDFETKPTEVKVTAPIEIKK
jgi:MFS family permease